MKENHDKPPAARPNKRAALPEVIRLAREGLNCREIAEKVGFSKTTVNRWLRAWRRKRAVKRAAESVEAIRHRIARYQVLADEFIDAWRRFQADEQMPLIEKTGAVEGPVADKKRSVRSERQTGNASYLAKAMEVEDRIEILQQRLDTLEGNPPASPGRRAISLANLGNEGLVAAEKPLRGNTGVLAFAAPSPETEPMVPGDAQVAPHTEREKHKLGDAQGEPPTESVESKAADAQSTPHAPCEVYKPADVQGQPHTPCEENKATEQPAKADPPRLTWQQQREILLHEAAEKKRKLKRYTDPKYCAYRWGR